MRERGSKNLNFHEVEVVIRHETDKAWLLSDDDERKDWFPKSQVEVHRTHGKPGMGTAVIPYYLAHDKGWI